MTINFPHDNSEVEVQSVQIHVNANELAEKDPELKRLFDIINECVKDVEDLIQIMDTNIKVVFEEAISNANLDKAHFSLGGLGKIALLGENITTYAQQALEGAMKALLENDMIEFNGSSPKSSPEEEQTISPWKFGV